MASKPVNIRWIRTSSQPYSKIMISIVLQAIFHIKLKSQDEYQFFLIIFHLKKKLSTINNNGPTDNVNRRVGIQITLRKLGNSPFRSNAS